MANYIIFGVPLGTGGGSRSNGEPPNYTALIAVALLLLALFLMVLGIFS